MQIPATDNSAIAADTACICICTQQTTEGTRLLTPRFQGKMPGDSDQTQTSRCCWTSWVAVSKFGLECRLYS